MEENRSESAVEDPACAIKLIGMVLHFDRSRAQPQPADGPQMTGSTGDLSLDRNLQTTLYGSKRTWPGPRRFIPEATTSRSRSDSETMDMRDDTGYTEACRRSAAAHEALHELPSGKCRPERSPHLRQAARSQWLILLLFLATAPAVSAAQPDLAETPMNAHAERYGTGWECDWGYRKVDQSCVAVAVPANAHLDSSWEGWECSRGYRPVNGACAVVEVPPRAFLDSRGRDWECDRGYRKDGPSCVVVKVPEHAYLAASGNRWSCERGFLRIGGACVAVEIPRNAYLTRSGGDWDCTRGYQRDDDSCVAIEVPQYGYLAASGRGWDCERGYKKDGPACIAFAVPANAHINYSGNDWACNPGYVRQGETCTTDKG